MYGDRGMIVPVELDGGTVLVEVGTVGGDAAAGGRFAWTDLKDTVARVTRQVNSAVTGAVTGTMPGRPTRCGVEFGVKLTVEANALVSVIAKAGGEATLVIRLEWDNDAAQNPAV